jgi:hypothetical protein
MATFDPIPKLAGFDDRGRAEMSECSRSHAGIADGEQLSDTIEQIEIVARCELEGIATIAALAIEALASRAAGQKIPELVRAALRMIQCKANEAVCDIQNYAMDVGCTEVQRLMATAKRVEAVHA